MPLIALLFKHMEQFIKFLKALTFKRMFLFGMFVAISLGGYVVFENRQTIYNQSVGRFDSVEDRQPMVLSDETKMSLGNWVRERPYIEWVQVVDMDLYKNVRTQVYWYSDKPYIQEAFRSIGKGAMTIPLLTDDVAQNKSLIALINMRDECSPADEGGAIKLHPQLKGNSVTTCRFPIPPRGGERINGFFAVHINKELTAFEMDQLRLQASQLAMQIFLMDVQKGNK